jgi:iron complex transport system substrate-binding protein
VQTLFLPCGGSGQGGKMRSIVLFLFFSLSGIAFGFDRVVSLSPALTDVLFFVGAKDKVKGVTTFSSAPESFERVGGIVNPSLEKIVSLHPDVVVATTLTPKTFLEKLSSYGIKVYVRRLVSLSDLEEAIEEIGNLVGKDGEKKKEEFLELLREETEKLKPCVRGKKVIFLISFRPTYVAGKKSYLGEILEKAGAHVVPEAAFTPVSAEFILTERPSFVVLALRDSREAEAFFSRFGIKSVKVAPDFILHPSPEVLKGLRILEKELCVK